MISQISLDSIYRSFPPINAMSMADAKTKKIALAFFAAITYSIGLLALCIQTGPVLFIAIPSFLTAGALTWAITRIKNYSDPSLVIRYRNEQKNMTLDQMIREHGWDNIMRHQIYDENFAEKFRKAAKIRTLKGVISLYEEAEAARKQCNIKLTIPHPREFKEKWNLEVKGKGALWVFARCDMEMLKDYEIITPSFYSAYTIYTNLKKAKEANLKKALQGCNEARNQALGCFKDYIEGLREGGPNEIDSTKSYLGEIQFLQSASPNEWFRNSLAVFRDLSSTSKENDDEVQVERRKLYEALQSAKQTLDTTIERNEESFQKACERINAQWKIS